MKMFTLMENYCKIDYRNHRSQNFIVYNSLYISKIERTVQIVLKPTYFRSGHVFNSKLVSLRCFRCKLDPKHVEDIIEHIFKYYKPYIFVLHMYLDYLLESAVYTSVHTPFLINKHTKIHIKLSQSFCAWYSVSKYIKDCLSSKKNHLKNNIIQISELPASFKKNFRIHLYKVDVNEYYHNMIATRICLHVFLIQFMWQGEKKTKNIVLNM